MQSLCGSDFPLKPRGHSLRGRVLVMCKAGFAFLPLCASMNAELLWPTIGVRAKVFSKLSAASTCPDLQLRFAGLQISQAPNFQVRFGLRLGARVATPL